MRYGGLLILCAAFAGAIAPARAYDFADARHVVGVGSPQISPDGSRVVYIRGQADFKEDRYERHLVLVDVKTGASRPLTYDRKGLGSPQWSPDGSAIAFSATENAEKDPQSQIFVMRMDGGDAQQITHAKNGVSNFAWSPDGKHFAYETQDENPDRKNIEKHLDAFEVHDNDYLHRTATPPVHVWLVDADGKHTKRLTGGAWSAALVDPDGAGTISWSPDSRTIAIEHLPTPFIGDSLQGRVDLIDVATGRMRALRRGESDEGSPAIAPHGDAIAYIRNTNGDYTQGADLYVAASNGSRLGDLRTQLDRNVEEAIWNSRGDALWLTANDRENGGLWYWPLHGRITRVPVGDLQPNSLGNVSKDGALVFIASRRDAPSEIFLLPSPSSKPVALTHENRLIAKSGIARSVAVNWHSTKGNFQEDGILTYPLHFHGGKVPLILMIHGGPQSASTLGWNSRRQVFASHGFFVFEPNYRGSTNLGDAYQHAIANDNGDGPGKDVMAGLAQVERTAPIDTSRIGVSGWSYGGYMTSWLIGHEHIWKAAVSGASLDDWLDDYNVSFYFDTDVPFFRGKPWNPKNTAEWREQSPIYYASQMTTPTLILGDIGDNNVTITNSFKLYHALKDNGTTVEFDAYPVGGHFPGDPVRSEDVQKRWLAWLERYLK